MMESYKIPKEGELHKVMTVGGRSFELRYGFYTEGDRLNSEPVILFPNLEQMPVYSEDGWRIVSSVQTPCGAYSPRMPNQKEDWCADCIFYPDVHEEIAVCGNEWQRRDTLTEEEVV